MENVDYKPLEEGMHLANQEWQGFLMTLALAIKMVIFSGLLNSCFLQVNSFHTIVSKASLSIGLQGM